MSVIPTASDSVTTAGEHPAVFDAEPVRYLLDDEPRTPSWLPITGMVLAAALLVYLLAAIGTTPDEASPSAHSRVTTSASAAASAGRPTAARPPAVLGAPTPAAGKQDRRAEIERVRKQLLQARRAARGTAGAGSARPVDRAGVRRQR